MAHRYAAILRGWDFYFSTRVCVTFCFQYADDACQASVLDQAGNHLPSDSVPSTCASPHRTVPMALSHNPRLCAVCNTIQDLFPAAVSEGLGRFPHHATLPSLQPAVDDVCYICTRVWRSSTPYGQREGGSGGPQYHLMKISFYGRMRLSFYGIWAGNFAIVPTNRESLS
jgi:hypothetical protein